MLLMHLIYSRYLIKFLFLDCIFYLHGTWVPHIYSQITNSTSTNTAVDQIQKRMNKVLSWMTNAQWKKYKLCVHRWNNICTKDFKQGNFKKGLQGTPTPRYCSWILPARRCRPPPPWAPQCPSLACALHLTQSEWEVTMEKELCFPEALPCSLRSQSPLLPRGCMGCGAKRSPELQTRMARCSKGSSRSSCSSCTGCRRWTPGWG